MFFPFQRLLYLLILFSLFGKLIQSSTVLDYDLGAEGDLFEAPKPVFEEPMVALDPMIAAISMISTAEDVDIDLMQNEQLLSEVFCEFKKDLMANEATGTSLSEVLQIQIPVAAAEDPTREDKVLPQINIPKSASSECLNSTGWIHGNSLTENYLEYPGLDFGAIYAMRRSYSEGDIKVIFSLLFHVCLVVQFFLFSLCFLIYLMCACVCHMF